MKIAVTSTDEIVEVDGVQARIWQGHTESGVPVLAFIVRVAVPVDAPQADFERELREAPVILLPGA